MEKIILPITQADTNIPLVIGEKYVRIREYDTVKDKDGKEVSVLTRVEIKSLGAIQSERAKIQNEIDALTVKLGVVDVELAEVSAAVAIPVLDEEPVPVIEDQTVR